MWLEFYLQLDALALGPQLYISSGNGHGPVAYALFFRALASVFPLMKWQLAGSLFKVPGLGRVTLAVLSPLMSLKVIELLPRVAGLVKVSF